MKGKDKLSAHPEKVYRMVRYIYLRNRKGFAYRRVSSSRIPLTMKSRTIPNLVVCRELSEVD